MTIYLTIFSIFGIISLFEEEIKENNYSRLKILSFFCILIFIGFRFEVGADWTAYLMFFNKNLDLDIMMYEYEIGYSFLNYIINKFNLGFIFLNFVLSAIFLICFYYFFNKTKNFFFILTMSLPMIIFIYGMGFNRQIVALGFFLVTINYFLNQKYLKAIIFFILSFLFHKSVIIFTPIFIFHYIILKVVNKYNLQKYLELRYLIIFFLVILTTFILLYNIVGNFIVNINDSIQYYYDAYIKMKSRGFYFRIAPILLSIITFFVFYKKLEIGNSELIMYLIFIFIIILFFFITFLVGPATLFDRLLVYLCIIQILIFEKIYLLIKNLRYKITYKLTVLSIYFAILFIWLTFADHRNSWMPYNNVIML